MKKQDFLWLTAVAVFLGLLVAPGTGDIYHSANAAHPYLLGFLKFAFLATMGDILSVRLVHRGWRPVAGLWARAVVYGFIGMLITLVMQLFSGGVSAAQASGFLPFHGNTFARALMTSAAMNCFFGPVFMCFHRISDTFIDLWCETKKRPTLTEAVQRVDFTGFVTFVVCKTIPLIWIPAHTVTFLLPGEYRVLFAACLSVVMGAILSFSKSKKSV